MVRMLMQTVVCLQSCQAAIAQIEQRERYLAIASQLAKVSQLGNQLSCVYFSIVGCQAGHFGMQMDGWMDGYCCGEVASVNDQLRRTLAVPGDGYHILFLLHVSYTVFAACFIMVVFVVSSSPPDLSPKYPLSSLLDGYQCARHDEHITYGNVGVAFSTGNTINIVLCL